MGLYNPQGNDWETCTSVLGYSNYAGFDPHCSCWDKQWYIGPDGRPYDFSTGRWMDPQAPGSFDPDNLNNYEYAANDPVNNIDPGNGAGPTKPPLPGTDQGNDVPLDPFAQQVFSQVYQDASYLEQPDFYLDWTEAATAAALATGAAAPIADMLGEGATALESEAPGTASAVTDFVQGYVRPWAPPASPAGVVGATVNGLTKLF